MAFKGITFAGQNVTPKNDGGLYASHYGDGILWGCSMSLSGDDLVIQSGEFIMGGRVVQVDGATNVDLSGRTLQTGYIQVIMNADMTQGEGSQWYTSFVESATTTFPALAKDDINDNGDLYQLQLAVVQISGGNLTAITSQLNASGLRTKEGPASAHMNMYADDGTLQSRLISNGTNLRLCRTSDNLSDQSGVNITSTNAFLYGNNGTVALRPSGYNNQNGELRVNNAGNIYSRVNTGGTSNTFYMENANGDVWGRIYASEGGNFRFAKTIGGTNDAGGVDITDTESRLYTPNGGTVLLRPNGRTSTSGQVQILSDGQQIGGHPLLRDSFSSLPASDTSLSAGTTRSITSYTSLESSGIYIVTGQVGFKANTANAVLILALSGTSSSLGGRCDFFLPNTGNHYFLQNLLVTGQTGIYLNIQCTQAGTILANSCGLRIVRIH